MGGNQLLSARKFTTMVLFSCELLRFGSMSIFWQRISGYIEFTGSSIGKFKFSGTKKMV